MFPLDLSRMEFSPEEKAKVLLGGGTDQSGLVDSTTCAWAIGGCFAQ